ncbi:DUF6270 domain-containing protein [Corynebacterium sp. P5848]|uniref:DUF6270 domain-containing protein n=1 Tax=Corynebacterium marambiense TaxID=2765364 RepID=UPI002260E219|nr:DUF6270 domain-containing protein [Corynebacterium marambiense]MCX7542898.1 DUF6270 domain-containing protein [Corynebacterium marambiense]
MNKETKKILVYGSCVARDTTELLIEQGWSVTKYVARQSLISAGTKVDVSLLDLPPDISPFNSRIIREDAQGNLYNTLQASLDQIDIVIWDIVPERLGVYSFPNGGYVSKTIEKLQAAGDSWHPSTATLIDFGTDKHFELWKEALARFVQFLRKNSLESRTYLISAQWAQVTNRPDPVYGPGPTVGNLLYSRYYEAVKDTTEIQIVSVPEELIKADANHKWGPAMFHYQMPVYRWIADSISAAALNPKVHHSVQF